MSAPAPPVSLPRRRSTSKLPPQHRASSVDPADAEAERLEAEAELRRQEEEAEMERKEAQRKEWLASRQSTQFPRQCFTEVNGTEQLAPLPRLQASSKKAGDRTKEGVHQFLAEH